MSKYCSTCGQPIPDTALYCPLCGAAQGAARPAGKLDLTQMIWAIVNFFLGSLPFAVIAGVLVFLAKDAAEPERTSYLKWARVLNLIGTILPAAAAVAAIVLAVLTAIGVIGTGLLFWL